jgi:hypothetical protein
MILGYVSMTAPPLLLMGRKVAAAQPTSVMIWSIMSKERQATEKELSPLVEVLAGQFIQRRDLYAKQLDDGSYVSVPKQLRDAHLFAHLRGDITLGAYLLDENSKGSFLVLDADDAPDWRRLKALAGALAEEETTAYLEPSRRGGHLWLFLADPVAGEQMRKFGRGLLAYFGIETIELFPKQDKLTTGPGSLIRLPFGVHRKSGRRYGFYLPDGEPLAPSLRQQIHALRVPQAVPEPLYQRFISYAPSGKETKAYERLEGARRKDVAGGEESLPERIRAAMPIRQFVLRYVELSPRGQGLCPFHDDHQPSFAVNDQGNYWNCFAGCGGGSVIDFYMLYQERIEGRECDVKTAISELAELLL